MDQRFACKRSSQRDTAFIAYLDSGKVILRLRDFTILSSINSDILGLFAASTMSTLESTTAFVSNTNLEPLFTFLQSSYSIIVSTWNDIPGSAVVTRYIKSSHRDDPGRTILEILLFLFAVRTLLQSRTRAEDSGKNFVQLSEKVSHRLSLLCNAVVDGWCRK